MTQRSYRSIGDVLTLLRAEFPDITISKIRVLESQGRVSPQRSPSGYRKFYDEDVERLRYVLLQQREHFLPLKVIRDRLNGDGIPSIEDEDAADVEGIAELDEVEGSSVAPTPHLAAVTVAPAPVAARPTPTPRPTVADVVAALQEAPPAPPAPAEPVEEAQSEPVAPVVAHNDPEPSDDALTAEELAVQTGLDVADVDLLVDYGILRPGTVAGLTCFEPTDVAIASAATRFLAAGVEPRHLRQFRNGVEREASLLEQLSAPMLRQRNPDARRHAEELIDGLAQAGSELRAALIEREIDRILGR